MELAEAQVEATVGKDFKWEPINIYPFGDLHLGGGGYEKLFREEIAVMVNDPRGYGLGMGDYLDLMSPSNRREIRAAKLYDSTLNELDNIGHRYVTHALNLMKGTKGRWLGMLEGHHFIEMSDGLTTDQHIAKALDAQFLGSCALVRIAFKGASPKRWGQTLTIWCHHGAGGGIKAASPLNKIENIMRAFDADAYLIGHQHKQVAAKMDQIYMTRKQPYALAHRQQLAACTGGYMRGYLLNSKVGRVPRGSYVERGMLAPSALGGIKLAVTPRQRRGLKMEVTL